MGNESIYLEAARELDHNKYDEALWVKALTIADGDQDKARYQYIQFRVEREKELNRDGFESKKYEENKILQKGMTNTDQVLVDSQVASPKNEETIDDKKLAVFRDPTTESWSLIGMTGLFVILYFIDLEMASSPSARAGSYHVVDVAALIIYPLFFAVFCVWAYVTKKNLFYFGCTDIKYSPLMTVVWNFVPLASLVMPYLAVKETLADSNPDVFEECRKDYSTVPPNFKWWWGCWIGALFLNGLNVALGLETNNSQTSGNHGILALAGILMIVSSLNLVSLVLDVRTMQLNKFEKTKREDSE